MQPPQPSALEDHEGPLRGDTWAVVQEVMGEVGMAAQTLPQLTTMANLANPEWLKRQREHCSNRGLREGDLVEVPLTLPPQAPFLLLWLPGVVRMLFRCNRPFQVTLE